MLRSGLTLAVATAVAVATSGCNKSQPDGVSTSGDPIRTFQASHARLRSDALDAQAATVTVATADRATTLDPHNTENGGDVKVINQVYETLVRINPTAAEKLLPALAEKWQIIDTGRAIRFSIRPNVKFHDGEPLNAEAVKRSLDRLRGTYLDVPAAPYRGLFDFIDQIEADNMTLTVTLNRPVALIALQNLTMFPASIISPKLLAVTEPMEPGEASAFISQWACGTGPYYLGKFDAGDSRVRLEAFDDYWGRAQGVKRIVFRQIADPNSRLDHLRSGEVDMIDDAPRPAWRDLGKDPKVQLIPWWAINVCYLGINVKHPKTADLPVRRAIQLAIDRSQLEKLYYRTARATYSLVAQPLTDYDFAYRPPDIDKPLGERQELARQSLAKVQATGRALKIYYPMDPRPYLPTPEKIADKLRQQLEQIGLNIEIVAVPNQELFENVKNDQYELVLIGWMSDNADADNFYIPLTSGDPQTQTPAPTNVGRLFDPDIHEMLIQAQQANATLRRTALYRRVERHLQERFINYVPLLNTQQAYAFRRRLVGVEIDPLGHYRFHVAALK